ncbi:hypothetical protein HPB49_016406 [Dermacentor silvarum]|uniref:Uncharacterized protein n=1 Tax=Dermacentor silvarum TaxID=543639 RepID=A0ACB8CYG8_DERSI|nr:hypothetical protein HPB49_016406 [Dermacentor silvarum]
MLASSAIHSEPGSKASKTVDEAASAAASAIEACGDDTADVKYCDPLDTGLAAVAMRLLRADEQCNKSSLPAHATPSAGRAPSADEMVHSPVLLLPGLQQQPRAGPLHPVPSSSSFSGVSVVAGRRGGITGLPSLRHACCQGPPPHQGSGGSTSASSGVQQQPAPTPRGSSSRGGGVRGFRSTFSDNVSSSSFPDNSPGRPDEKRGQHGPLQSVATGSSHVASTTTPLWSGSDCALQSFRASPSIQNLSSCSCDGPRRSEKKRGGLVAVAPPIVGSIQHSETDEPAWPSTIMRALSVGMGGRWYEPCTTADVTKFGDRCGWQCKKYKIKKTAQIVSIAEVRTFDSRAYIYIYIYIYCSDPRGTDSEEDKEVEEEENEDMEHRNGS